MALIKIPGIDDDQDDIEFLHSTGDALDFVICKRPEKLSLLVNSLQPGKSTHFISEGSWSMHDLVLQLLKKLQPAELFITTYALREFPVRQLIMAMDRKEVSSIKMLLDSRAKIRTPEVYQLASMNMTQLFLTNIHAKVTVIRSPEGCATVVGSCNWTQNPKIEAGVVSLNKDVANFHINWIEKICSHAEIFE